MSVARASGRGLDHHSGHLCRKHAWPRLRGERTLDLPLRLRAFVATLDVERILVRAASASFMLQDCKLRFQNGRLCNLDCVLDFGFLSSVGFAMQLRACRWDVLGKVKEVLAAIADLLAMLRRGGKLLLRIHGDPQEFLMDFLQAFPVTLQHQHDGLTVCELQTVLSSSDLNVILEREVHAECSHGRYVDLLRSLLPGTRCSILDVGGGDGHMAACWKDSAHDVFLLEVSTAEAAKAAALLGEERVTLHDGVSPWPFQDGAFDVCLMLFVLHHVAPLAALRMLLAEAARVGRRAIVLEDAPHAARTPGLQRLACAVTAEHFRPFGQDPAVYMRNIRRDDSWQVLFREAGFRTLQTQSVSGTLQHPVPHVLYVLESTLHNRASGT